MKRRAGFAAAQPVACAAVSPLTMPVRILVAQLEVTFFAR
jgi:hypothetical protein